MDRISFKNYKYVILLLLFAVVFFTGVVFANGGPHGDYISDTDLCALCHRTHTAVTDSLISSPSSGNAFCLTCHNGTGAATAPVISTHSNIDAKYHTEDPFMLECVQCHNPHGDYDNLFAVRSYIFPQTGSIVTDGPVEFIAITGLGSYDDGSGNGVCILCHTNHSLTNHEGGADHVGGINFENANCITCHPHSSDNLQNTGDGFMPVASCTGCHATEMGPRRQITGEYGDFSMTSHHINGVPTDDDCLVCHETGNHGAGNVELINVYTDGRIILNDDPMIVQAEAEKLESFCLACHDSDGANGSPPFSDLAIPPRINADSWTSGSHSLNDTTCYNCHNNGHGSVKNYLLGPWNATADNSLPDDNWREEEGFCFLCHGLDGDAMTNIQDQFNSISRHNISRSDQLDGSKVECVNCHNPHQANSTNKLANPDSTDHPWLNTNTAFCLTCHDGNPPLSVVFPPNSPGTGYNKSGFMGTTHETAIAGTDDCQGCHYAHGAPPENIGYPSLLRDQYSLMDDFEYPPIGQGTHFALCWTCHEESFVLNLKGINNNFEKKHSKHVLRSGGTTCLTCHDTHAPYDRTEPGLINFVFSVNNSNYDISWISLQLPPEENASNSFWIDTAANRGYCSIACHGANHINKYYVRLDPAPTNFEIITSITELP
jgi:predicted CXXCH cytochrome family protein